VTSIDTLFYKRRP